MFIKLGKIEAHLTKDLYTCEVCEKTVCMSKCGSTSTICTKWGTLIVSKINEGDTPNRRVQEVGLGDASADDVGVSIHRSEE